MPGLFLLIFIKKSGLILALFYARIVLSEGKGLKDKSAEISHKIIMYNWSVDIDELKKDKKKYAVWRLEQMVNFGLDGKKINCREIKKYWKFLSLDPAKKKYLKMILWPKQS